MELASWSNAASIARGLFPVPTHAEVTEGDKVWLSLLPVPTGPREDEGAAPLGSWAALRRQCPEAWHCHSPDTYPRQPRQLRTPQPARRRRERGQLARGSVRERWGRAVRGKKKKKVGRDRDRGRVSERFKSRPFPALVPRVLREHPRHRPSSSSTRLPPPSLPSWSPPQAPEGHGGYSVPGKLGSSRELR